MGHQCEQDWKGLVPKLFFLRTVGGQCGVFSAYTEDKLVCENSQPYMLFVIGTYNYHGCVNADMVRAGSADSHIIYLIIFFFFLDSSLLLGDLHANVT